MAHFYGGVEGKAKTTATRLGSRNSGIETFCQGWDSGVDVRGEVSDGQDMFRVYVTHGSNGGGHDILLGTFLIQGDAPVFVISNEGRRIMR